MELNLSNLGVAAGAGVQSYLAARADYRAQDESDAKKRESDRIEKMRKEEDDINMGIAEKMKKRLLITDKPEKLVAPSVNPASVGISATAPQAAPAVADQQAPVTSPAQGIGAPIAQPEDMNALATPAAPEQTSPAAEGIAKPEEKKAARYSTATVDDMAWAAQEKQSAWMEKGNLPKAIEAHKDYMAFAAEKLQQEQVLRTEMSRKLIPAIAAGDFSGLDGYYKLLPDGKHISKDGVKENKDGTITVTTEDANGKKSDPATFKDRQALANAVGSLADPQVALKYMEAQSVHKLKEVDQKETERNHRATEENNADKIAMLQAKIDAKQLKGDDLLKQVKDAADKYGIAYGIKTDTLGNLIMPPDLSAENKKKYFEGLEQLQGLIQGGAQSYAAVNYLYKNQADEQARAKVSGKATVNPAAAGTAPPPKTAPAPQPGYSVSASVKIPVSLPKGTTQIGTSGGKPVYQKPDGSKVIGE